MFAFHSSTQGYGLIAVPRAKRLKRKEILNVLFFICQISLSGTLSDVHQGQTQGEEYKKCDGARCLLIIMVVGEQRQLVPGPQMAWHRHRVPLGTGFTYCTVHCIML